MSLQLYKSIAEKQSAFASHTIVNTKQELEDCLEDLQKKENRKKERFVFRGVNNAKFKLYTSAQRFYEQRDLGTNGIKYDESIMKMINHSKIKGNPMYSYLLRLGVVQNDWQILSFLQHYGAPSPLLDFSRKYKAALFFAIDDIEFRNEQDVDNYVSIYYYKMVDAANKFSRTIIKIAEEQAKLKRSWNDGFWEELSYQKVIQDNTTIILPAYSTVSKIKNSKDKLISTYTIANLNATAQEGEFVCNGDQIKPLEDLWVDSLGNKCIHCIDIHKGLYEYILQNVFKCKIEEARQQYYPNEHSIAIETEKYMLSNL